MNAVYRIAELQDVDDIANLVNRAYRPASSSAKGWTHESGLVTGARTSADQVRALFVNDSVVLLMSQGLRLLACVHVRVDGAGAHIGMLATEPSLQAQGLGKLMLAYAEKFALDTYQVDTFKMSVLSSRHELMAFYERRGYMRSGFTCAYPVDSGVGEPLSSGMSVLELIKTAANPDA
jgi:ribosomal protein S18 acetylase RimI-like enzyme